MANTAQLSMGTSGSITSGHVVQFVGGLAVAASVSGAAPFDGVALQTTTTGQSNIIQTGGLLSPNIVSLGDGYACAIGLDNSGNPVRVTNALCTSGLKYIGTCDIHGVITVTPRVSPNYRLDDFGGDPTGASDSGHAFDAMISKAIAPSTLSGAEAFIPPGTWRIDGYRTIYNAYGLKLRGVGNQSVLQWNGNSTDPLLNLSSCYACSFEDFGITTPTSRPLAIGIKLTTSSAIGHHIGTRNSFTRIGISGTTNEVQECVVIGGDLDNNNDFHLFTSCNFANYNLRAVRIQDSQAYQHTFINCFFQAYGWASATGSMATGTANLSVTTNTFTAADVGKFVEVATAADGTNPLRTTIVTVTDAQHVVLAINAGATVTNVQVYTGAGEGIRANGGSYTVQGGFAGAHLNADFYISNISSQSMSLRDTGSEGSRCFVQTSGLSAGSEKIGIIEACRYSGDAALASIPCLNWELAGQLDVRSCQFGDAGNNFPITILLGSYSFTNANAAQMTHRFENCIFATSGGTKVSDVFLPNGVQPRLQNCRIYSATTLVQLPDTNIADEAKFGNWVDHQIFNAVKRVTTANATPTTAYTFLLGDLPVIGLEIAADLVVTVLAKNQADGYVYRSDHRATYSIHSGGAPTLQGSLISGPPIATGTMATASSTVTTSGNNIIIQVTGIASTNISWSVIVQAQTVT